MGLGLNFASHNLFMVSQVLRAAPCYACGVPGSVLSAGGKGCNYYVMYWHNIFFKGYFYYLKTINVQRESLKCLSGPVPKNPKTIPSS